MFDYVKGNIAELTPADAVIECGGIGFHAQISVQTYEALEGKTETKLYLHHILREDEELFYGFASKDERELFRLLISVSGVGAATARMMLSSLSDEEIRSAILSEDLRKIKSIKGIGLKTAQRLILELKDKITKGEGTASTDIIGARIDNAMADEAVTALVLLGFPKAAAGKVVANVISANPGEKIETIIKLALKQL